MAVWIFVTFAFLNKKTAYINVYIIIPLIYISHLLPFHTIIKLKELARPDSWRDDIAEFTGKVNKTMPFGEEFLKFHIYIDKNCYFSPISVQGIMIFGLLSSICRLYPPF